MTFIDWVSNNKDQLAYVLADTLAREPKSFDDADGRFSKDKFHIAALELKFPNTFTRIENSHIDLSYTETGETISMKSQETIFQYPAKRKDLYTARNVIIVNSNSTYGAGDMDKTVDSLKKVDYWLFYHKQTLEHTFMFGVISTEKLIKYLRLSGSQFVVQIPNDAYDFTHTLNYTNTFDRDKQSLIYNNAMLFVYSQLLS